MKIDVLTLFPDMFAPLEQSIMKRAQDKGRVDIRVTNIRDFAFNKHRMVDDYPYGGGAGMVMKPDPIFEAVDSITKNLNYAPRVVLTSPQGEKLTQRKALELSKEEHLVFVCGHYEGIDERVRECLITDEISVGDFILTGGELPSMVMIDSIVRLLPGVLGDDFSAQEESFSDGLLEYPHYTRPPEYAGYKVPDVLLSGNHENIRIWRRQKSLEATWKKRPDLLKSAALSKEDIGMLNEIKDNSESNYRLFTALVHYPVYNKKMETINTSITNLDLHDIARASATYDVEAYFIIQPIDSQRDLINTLLKHWQRGFGAKYNPDRKEALSKVVLVKSIEEVKQIIADKYGDMPKVISTDARAYPQTVGYKEMRDIMNHEGGNFLLLFGTGWGLEQSIIDATDYMLKPIYGPGDYNHLSVRSAVSIILDRLQGEKWW